MLKSKAWASITWVGAPTAYLAQFWVLDGIVLEIWSAKTLLFYGYRVVMAPSEAWKRHGSDLNQWLSYAQHCPAPIEQPGISASCW